MINYKSIADNDPGGDLETAFNTMADEVITETPEVMITYRKIGAAVSLTASFELEAAIKASAQIPTWVDDVLRTDGIDVNDPQVSATLGALVSAQTAADILLMGQITKPKYEGLKLGHLQNAREMRSEGKI